MYKGGRKKTPKLKLGRFACWGLSGTGRLAGPYHFDADPDPSVHFNADPDPSFHFNADQDPSFHFNADPDPSFHFNQSHHQYHIDVHRDHLSSIPHPMLHLSLRALIVSVKDPPLLYFEPLKLLNFDFNADQDLHGSRSSLFWESGSGFPK